MDESQGPRQRGQCIAGLPTYFPAYAGIKLYCLVSYTCVRKHLPEVVTWSQIRNRLISDQECYQ